MALGTGMASWWTMPAYYVRRYTEDAWADSMPVRACVRMPAAPNSSDINDTVGTRVLCYSTVFEKWEACVADTACPGICAPMSSPSLLGANSVAAWLVGSTLVRRGVMGWRRAIMPISSMTLASSMRDAGPRPKDPLGRSVGGSGSIWAAVTA